MVMLLARPLPSTMKDTAAHPGLSMFLPPRGASPCTESFIITQIMGRQAYTNVLEDMESRAKIERKASQGSDEAL